MDLVTYFYRPMDKEISKEEILATIVGRFFDDLEFIESLNNLTYSRKVQLKRNQKTDQTNM